MESFFTRALKLPITTGLMIAAIITSVMFWDGRDISLLVVADRAFADQPWRLLTTTLPHGGLLHLGFNLYWVWFFGSRAEEHFGPARMIGLVVLLAAGSSAAEYALFIGGIGLSGVGYGFFGLFYWLERQRYPAFVGTVDRQTTVIFVAWFFICIAGTITGTMPIANVAHGSGALLGLLVGMITFSRPYVRRWAAGALVATLVLIALTSTVARPWVNLSGAY